VNRVGKSDAYSVMVLAQWVYESQSTGFECHSSFPNRDI